MKTIDEALEIIKLTSISAQREEAELLNSLGCILFEDVLSPIDLPPFSQSAMDGYAICGDSKTYKVIGEIKAGDSKPKQSMREGEAYRIFTGAIVPDNVTSIAKQEIVDVQGTQIRLNEPVKTGTSIRHKGEELAKGDLAMKKGSLMNAAAVGLLSGIGVQKVMISRKPKVSIIVSGNELTKLGNHLDEGKIYESNSYTLQAALLSIGISSQVHSIADDFEQTVDSIKEQLKVSDFVILTGGISVGDYDFVKEALAKLEVEELFYKVKQKPGKPIFYGKKGMKRIFALPGNPAAVLTCFYMYVVPSIKMMMNREQPMLERMKAVITEDFIKKGDRGFLLKAKLENGKVSVHIGQSSAMLSSFVEANCLLYLKEDEGDKKAGDEVNVFLINS